MAYSRPTASSMKSPQKSQIVTSDNYELTFILSEQVFEVSPSVLTRACSRPRHIIECLADDTLVQTRQDHAVIRRRCSSRINFFTPKSLNLYKLINVNFLIKVRMSKLKSLNKLLKKLQDSGSVTRGMGSSRRHRVCSDASPVFTRYSTNI